MVMAKKKRQSTGTIANRKARHDYDLKEDFVAGLVLSGAETKSLRRGHGHLRGAYVTIKDNELWLINCTITGDTSINIEESDQTRARKLLIKHKELDKLIAAKQQGLTIVPLDLLTRGRYIKLRISAGRGKKLYDKRNTIKQRDESRAAQVELKRALR